MSRRLVDGEERSLLDYFAGAMDFLTRDKILIPFSYTVISFGALFGAYQLISRNENPISVEMENHQNLEAIAYDFPKQR